jgi:outer membrane receptor protein involved in Fe transport
MVKYIQTDTYDASSFEQVRFAANLTGSLFEIVENDPVAVAVGAEYRKDTGSSTPDDAKVRGEIIGFNQANPLAGTINAKEVYGELRVPLLEMLSVEAGARYSKYSTVGGLFNYKFGAEFKPFDALKFRGAYNKAARAPAVFELFQNGDQGFPTYVDPCGASRNPTAAVLGICRSQAPGFDFAGFAQNNTQVQAFAFGNPDLEEERAETWTVGAVFSSGNVLGGTFSATADWYDIKITNLNASLGSSYFINDCYNNANATSCARIQRSAATGQIDRISTTRINSDSSLSTKGLDVSVNYALPLDAIFSGADGRIRIANLFTYVDSYKVGDTELAGLTSDGIGGTTSKYANTMTVGYENGPFTTQVRWVYKAGGNQDDALFGNDEDAGFATAKIPDLSVFDLSTRLRITDSFSATFIVDNVFDKSPPQTATGTFEQANSNVSFYEPYLLGRGYTIQATFRF